MNIGIVGAGYWGQRLIQTILKLEGFKLKWVVDRHNSNRSKVEQQSPETTTFTSLTELNAWNGLDLVVVATQASSHFEALKFFCSKNVPVLVEKPFCRNLKEASEIINLFERANLPLQVDHTYLHSKTYQAFKNAALTHFSDQPLYWTSQRLDFGNFPKDIDVTTHLAYHDLYMLDDIFDLSNFKVHSTTESKLPNHPQSVASILNLASDNRTITISTSMISPQKRRELSVTNLQTALVWDDLNTLAPVQVFNYENYKITGNNPIPIASLKTTPLEEMFLKIKASGLDKTSVQQAYNIHSLLERTLHAVGSL